MSITWSVIETETESAPDFVLNRITSVGPVSGGYLLRVDLDGDYKGYVDVFKTAQVFITATTPLGVSWSEQNSKYLNDEIVSGELALTYSP